jgi:G6PDH family F420-dependent oxidoreductase
MSTIEYGYKLMSEEHGPGALVENAKGAEAAGFEFAAISDHYLPWLAEQGHSPFAWSVLGAIAQATRSLGLLTAVTCPTFRYHPAVIAQAAATLGLLSRGRFTLGIGSGERLNEHVVGSGWPAVVERQTRLAEACEILRMLLHGEDDSYHGQFFTVVEGALCDRPEEPPQVVVAAGGPRAARLAATCADGLVATEPKAEIVRAFRDSGGKGPRYAEVLLCYAADEARARQTAHRNFRWSALGWKVLPELPGPDAFAEASRAIRPEDLDRAIALGPDVERHVKAIRPYVEAGFDRIILVQIGPEQERFLEFFETELRPALRERIVAS